MGTLSGRTAVVTGANGGLGLGFAQALLAAGATVDIWARDVSKTAIALDQLADRGHTNVTSRRCDVINETDVQAAFAGAVAAHGRIDIMIANAGAGRFRAFTETTLDDWRAVTSVYLDGAFLCFREAARHMVTAGGGSLIAVSSISAVHGTPRHAAYAASKAGLTGLVRTAAVELARHHIRVNAIQPGWITTDTHPDIAGNDALVEATRRRTPVRRWGNTDDLDAAIVFLADPDNVFHTGDTTVVDGGYTAQ